MTKVKQFSTEAARALARADSEHPFWSGRMRQTLEWACDIIDAADAALDPKRIAAEKKEKA